MSEEAYSTAIAAEDLSSMSELIRRGSDYVDVMDRELTEEEIEGRIPEDGEQ